MKKTVILRGSIALFAIGGLLVLPVVPGFGSSPYRYASDACAAILLLAFGEQILMTGLLLLVRLGDKLKDLVGLIQRYNRQASRPVRASVSPEKKRKRETTTRSLLMAVLLIWAGTLSPSDGVDSGLSLSTGELLTRALIILVLGVGAILLVALFGLDKAANPARLNAQQKDRADTGNEQAPVSEKVA